VDLDLARRLSRSASTKIVLCVLDGLGGLARQETLRSELEKASIPNLDRLAVKSEVGLTTPVGAGITPGSGPGHLALFGYDPYRFEVGRGILEATGIEFDLRPGDVAARGNFCTLDSSGNITDRRAGRIPTERAAKLVERLQSITAPGAQLLVAHVKDHRFVVVFRGSGLGANVSDTDPQALGVRALPAQPLDAPSATTSNAANSFITQATDSLRNETAANGLLLR
jgi:2,3-bisphosphoglycerate-independent phosphoglycerate mutase